MPTMAANALRSCQRLIPSMDVSPSREGANMCCFGKHLRLWGPRRSLPLHLFKAWTEVFSIPLAIHARLPLRICDFQIRSGGAHVPHMALRDVSRRLAIPRQLLDRADELIEQ